MAWSLSEMAYTQAPGREWFSESRENRHGLTFFVYGSIKVIHLIRGEPVAFKENAM
jgi:hypothetical protein